MKSYSQLIFIVIIILWVGSVFADSNSLILFVSPEGNDTWSGKLSQPNEDGSDGPVASLDGARKAVRMYRQRNSHLHKIEVIIREGEYLIEQPIEFTPLDGGNDQCTITYRAAKNSHPVFLGGRLIDNFVIDENGIWISDIEEVKNGRWYFEQLFVNGKRAVRARSPNSFFYRFKNVREVVHLQGSGRAPQKASQHIQIENTHLNMLASLNKSELYNVMLTVYHKWDITRRFINGIDTDKNEMITSGQGMKPWNAWKANQRYALENFRAALDVPGEWFLDPNGTLHYMPYPGQVLVESQIIAPVTEKFLIFRGDPKNNQFVSNISIEGLSFQYTNYISPSGGFEPSQAAYSIDAVIQLDGVKHIQIKNCEIAHVGRYAVWFRQGCSYSLADNCYLHDLGAGGIRVGEGTIREDPEELTHHIELTNNIIEDAGNIFPPAVGIWIGHSSDNKISHNEIADLYYTGISVGWRWGYDKTLANRNIIEYNHIHHIGWGLLSDMGGIYTLGPSEGTKLVGNVIHDIYAYDYGGWGIYPDEGSSYLTITDNLVYRTKTGGFHQHYGKENLVYNNIFANSKMSQLQCTRVESHKSFTFKNNILIWEEGTLLSGPWDKINVTMDSNCYWQTSGSKFNFNGLTLSEWRELGHDHHSVLENPEFKDMESGDFLLGNKSIFDKTGFIQFDESEAGPKIKSKWLKKTQSDKKQHKRFVNAINFKVPEIHFTAQKEKGSGNYLLRLEYKNADHLFYTLDGSTPGTESRRYLTPIAVERQTVMKVIPVVNGALYWPVLDFNFNPHKAFAQQIILEANPSKKYNQDSNALVDGQTGSSHFNDGNWLGFEKDDFIGTIQMSEEKKISKVTVRFLDDHNNWIFLPEQIIIAISNDGKHFEILKGISNRPVISYSDIQILEYECDLKKKDANYIRIHAKNIQYCPNGHHGAGGKAWIFIDEIVIE